MFDSIDSIAKRVRILLLFVEVDRVGRTTGCVLPGAQAMGREPDVRDGIKRSSTVLYCTVPTCILLMNC
jgi:hypothetical protein